MIFDLSGVAKDLACKILGSQWTLKIWKDEDDIWGCYLRCRELPHLNIGNSFVEGTEKKLKHPMFGGTCKVKD